MKIREILEIVSMLVNCITVCRMKLLEQAALNS